MSESTEQPVAAPGSEFQQGQQPDVSSVPMPAARADIQISPQLYLGSTVYVAKDPVSLSYYRLQPAEYFVFQNLNGKATPGEIAEKVNARFPDQPTTPEEVHKFVRMMQTSGLLLGRGESHGKFLRAMRDRKIKKVRTAKVLGFMFFKIPVLDPDELLDVMYSFVRPCFHRLMMWLAIAFIAVTGVAVAMELGRIGELAFPILGWRNLLLLSVVFFTVKVVHEFGHGLAAKHYGLEVHEMGVMFMVFLPLYYVDVSDAWMVPRKRDRIWISLGGVFIEMLVASAGAWIWLNTSPGLINQIVFNVMLAASVTTVLFNANPLLRYDGYYVLMDWLEIPNMRTKAMAFLGYLAKRYLLGMPEASPPPEAAKRPIFMPIYAVAAAVYRWVVVFGIIALVWHILDPYGLSVIGSILGFFAMITMVGLPMLKLIRFVLAQHANNMRRIMTSSLGVIALTLVATLILSIPFEHAVENPAVLVAAKRHPLYIPWSGRVAEVFVTEGQTLKKGTPILRITDQELQDQLASMRVRQKQLRLSLDVAQNEGRIALVADYADQIKRAEEKIAWYLEKQNELIVKAPIAGRISTKQSLRRMIGMKLDVGNEIGVIIGDGPRVIRMVLPQEDAPLIKKDLPARVRLWGAPGEVHHGRVSYIGTQFIEQLPHESLSSRYKGEVDMMPTERYNAVPAERSVIAEITLAGGEAMPTADGMTARAKVVLDRSGLGRQQWRLIRQALSLDWWL